MATSDMVLEANQVPQVELMAGVRVRGDILFRNSSGVLKPALKKRAQNTLEKLRRPLEKLLRADEAVLYVLRAQAPVGILEQLTLGWYIYRVSATVLVVTNHRLLHFACDWRGNWTRSTRTVAWGELAEAKVRAGLLTGALHLKLRSGSNLKYWGIGRADIKKLRALVPALHAAPTGHSGATAEMPHLCPECFAALTSGVYECRQCGTAFKNEKTMVRRSLLIPGGGYFYCKQAFLGLADFMAEAVLTLMFLVFLAGALSSSSGPQSNEALIFAVIFGVLLAVEKAFTIHHCRRFIREFIPEKPAQAGMRAMAVGR